MRNPYSTKPYRCLICKNQIYGKIYNSIVGDYKLCEFCYFGYLFDQFIDKDLLSTFIDCGYHGVATEILNLAIDYIYKFKKESLNKNENNRG